VAASNLRLRAATTSNTLAGAGPTSVSQRISRASWGLDLHDTVEVHAVNTDRRIVLDTQVDVFADTEAEVASLREIALTQFVLLDLEATLQNFEGLQG
jgi:hypothetical protein